MIEISRRVFTKADKQIVQTLPDQDITEKILNYIPAEIVAAFISINAIFMSVEHPPTLTTQWIVFVILIALTALYTWKTTSHDLLPMATTQIVISTAAFVIWVYTLGGPFVMFSWYQPYWGTILVTLFTLLPPLLFAK